MSLQNQVLPLPLEVISTILSKLPFQDKLNARLVCNYWRTILDEFGNYEFQAEISDNTLFDYLLNSFIDVEYVGLSGVTKPMSSTYSRNKFPRIRGAILGNQNSASVVLSFFKYGLVYAEGLIIEEYAFQDVHKSQISSVLKECKWENLLQLELTIQTEDDKMKSSRKHVAAMSCFLEFARIPYLKDFTIQLNHNSNLDDDGSQFQKFCAALYGFINRHSETLKSLSWELKTKMQNGFPDVSPIPIEIMEMMRSDLKLETYAVRTPDYNALTFALSPVCGSDGLTSFKTDVLSNLSDSSPGMDLLTHQSSEAIGQILKRNSKTLTDIYIRIPHMDMNMFRNCHKLKSLYIGVRSFERGEGNLSTEDVKFPELKSFGVFGVYVENSNFASWIVERMQMVEKIKFTTIPAFLTVPVLQNLVNGLSRLKEIAVEIDMINLGFQGHELNTYCDETEGLTFKYDEFDEQPIHLYRSYVIEIVR